MDEMRIVVVGCGKRGHVLAKQFDRRDDCTVVCVVDANESTAHQVAAEVGECTWGTDYEKAINETEAEILIVATPVFLHVPVSLLGIEKGMHVLCEKPLALTMKECDRLVERAMDKKVQVAVHHQLRTLPAYRKAVELVRSDALGHPLMVRRHFANSVRPNVVMHDRYRNNGVVMDVCCHTFDIVRYLLGSEAVRVSATGSAFAFGRPEVSSIDILAADTASMNIEYANGSVLSMSACWGLPPGVGADALFDVVGPKGLLKIETKRLVLIREGGEEEVIDTFDESGLGLHEDFLQAIREGRRPFVSAEDGRESVRVSLAALESIESGTPVAIVH
jgi:predicted dehydrogenase